MRYETNAVTGVTIELPDEEPTPIPQPTLEELRSTMVLTPAQARIKLAGLGLLDGIETTIAALPITDVVSIYWYYATEFRRLDSTLIGFCTSTLGMSATQLDEIFTSSLTP